MKKKHIIAITGDIASGKGAVTEVLIKKLDYSIYRNGEYFRKLACEYNMSVKDFNIYVEGHPQIDIEIEKSAEKYAKEHDNLIIDARLGWYVVPESFKVYLTVDLDEAARRVLNDKKRIKTEKYNDFEHARKNINERYNLENDRYYKLYGVKKHDLSNYDFVIDTTNYTPEQVADHIIQQYEKWLKK